MANRNQRFGSGERPPRARVALWLALGGLLVTFVGTVGAIVGLGMLSSALVMGIQARRESKRTGADATGATPAIVISAVSLFFVVIGLVGFVVFSDEILAYEECSRGANTEVSRQACMDELMEGLRQRLAR